MRVSVIISNRNDDAMLSVTVRSVLEELRPLGRDGEVIIVDNSDEPIYKHLEAGSYIPPKWTRQGLVRLVRQDYPCLFTARETAFKEAKSDLVLCLDSHMLVGHRMIADLVEFMERRKEDSKMGFAHAPISWCHHHEDHSKHDRCMKVHELGDWNRQYNEERRITWKGMPWIVRKEVFWAIGGYGALSEHKISWGGGDMHIGIKPWLLGFENWAVPCAPAIHIGPFPKVANSSHKYRLYSASGKHPASFGFLVACYTLGGEAMLQRNLDAVWNHQAFGWQSKRRNPAQNKKHFEDHVALAKKLGERERKWMLERQIMSFEELLEVQPWNQ